MAVHCNTPGPALPIHGGGFDAHAHFCKVCSALWSPLPPRCNAVCLIPIRCWGIMRPSGTRHHATHERQTRRRHALNCSIGFSCSTVLKCFFPIFYRFIFVAAISCPPLLRRMLYGTSSEHSLKHRVWAFGTATKQGWVWAKASHSQRQERTGMRAARELRHF